MPRDLSALVKEDTLQGMPQLTKSPQAADPVDGPEYEDQMLKQLAGQYTAKSRLDELHPYTQTLTIADIESCIKLEDSTFPPQERCTREKFQYRLTTCGELSLGIFTSSTNIDDPSTAATSSPVYSGAPDRKCALLGHIIATKSTNATVTDDDMNIPRSHPPSPSESHLGHKEPGRTLCIHSVAVLPDYQGRGLGTTLLKAYLQRMESCGVADRAALIAHDGLVNYYEGFGFRSLGPSKCEFGGGGWTDMVIDFKKDAAFVP